MNVEFLSKFNKDLDKLKTSQAKASVLKAVLLVESANHLSEITISKNFQVINQHTG